MKRNFSSVSWKSLLFVGTVGSLLSSCGPVPRRQLTGEEKIADMYWVYSQFGQNYAPIEYKQKLHGFDYTELKKHYLELAQNTKDNDEFYNVMYGFIAEFKDAHTSGALSNSALPGRAQVAYLGFSGLREGNHYVVTELLPTMNGGDGFPLSEGDVITAVDGVPLADIVKNEMVKVRNLGSDEANLTYHMNKIFNRVSTYGSLPAKDTVVLTIKEDDEKTKDVTLPWIVKDLRTFRLEQTKATSGGDSEGETNEKLSAVDALSDVFDALGSDGQTLFQMSFVGFDGRVSQAFKNMFRFRPENRADRFLNNFTFVDNVARWTTKIKAAASPLDLLKEERNVPSNAIMLPASRIYPTYVVSQPVLDEKGEETAQKRLVGVMRLDTFSPMGDPTEEVGNTLTQLRDLGVKDLLIDMVDNGGGSLALGIQLAQMMTSKKLAMPAIRLAINETWLDDFERLSLDGPNDYMKEIGRRTYARLKTDLDSSKRISDAIPMDVLMPVPGPDSEEADMNIVLLVNEMCASMCDIFSAIMQDNKAAKVVGTQTMGAGGNVVTHFSAPNSQLSLNQTESLIIRSNGQYIENNGVKPDVEIPVNASASSKYEDAINEALKQLGVGHLKNDDKEKDDKDGHKTEGSEPSEESVRKRTRG